MPLAPVESLDAEQVAYLRRWNWGAFWLNWIWSIGNNTWIGLLIFVPVIGLVMPFVLGAKGNAWAWRNHSWASFEDFKRVQRNWARAGLLFVLATLAACGLVFGSLYQTFSHNRVYALTRMSIKANPSARLVLGTPITFGWPSFAISEHAGGAGTADIAVSAQGPKGHGEIVVHAERRHGQWQIKTMTLHPDGSTNILNLLHPQAAEGFEPGVPSRAA
ncbi:MAG: hypothetical protein KGQ37_06535 [Hyphomicrobiales bacterium]|nr:hypothetical protein [Hyphomicrobiales bacterium]